MINQVSAGYALFKGIRQQIPDPIVSRFRTWDDCVEASEHEDEPDLVRLVRIIEQYTDEIPEILQGMKKRHCPDVNRAKIIVGTAHKSKGLEYDHVIIKSEEHTSELQSLMRISYAVFCLKQHTSKISDNNTHTLYTETN